MKIKDAYAKQLERDRKEGKKIPDSQASGTLIGVSLIPKAVDGDQKQ